LNKLAIQLANLLPSSPFSVSLAFCTWRFSDFMVVFGKFIFKEIKVMPKACEIKKHNAIDYNGRVMIVRDIERSVPQGRAGGSLYRMRMYDVVTGGKVDETFKAEEMLNLADLVRRPVMLSYIDGEEHVFMDEEDYTPYNINTSSIAEQVLFINEETKGLQAVLVEGSPVSIDLPSSVELVIEDTSPSIKGASASARTKPATLTTGLIVQVPEHISTGDKIKINTDEKKFMGRADS
jgi:elongation factor P